MHRYVVANAHAQIPCITLCDAQGRFHVARTADSLPPVGTRLTGNTPALGFGLLLGESLDKVYRVTFEAVDCGRDLALSAMRPASR